MLQHTGIKRREGHVDKYPQESISSARSTPGASPMCQYQNPPPPSQPTAASIHEPLQLSSQTHTAPPITHGGDSYQGPVQGDFMFQISFVISR